MNATNVAELAQHHLDYLANRIGCRMIGTSGNEQAASYIFDTLTQANLDCRRQRYASPAWSVQRCELLLGTQPVEVIANTFTPSSSVTARFQMARTIEELEGLDVSRRILVLGGEFTRSEIMPLREHAVYLPERDKRIGQLLRQKQPLGIITVSVSAGYLRPLLEDWSLDIATVTVPADVGLLLAVYPDLSLTLDVATTRGFGETSNVIGQNLTPTGATRVLVCAHYDTKYGTVGGRDNASGTAALLSLAQTLASSPPPLSLEFVAFSAEEYDTEDTNDDAYLREYGLTIPPYVFGEASPASRPSSALDDVLAVINFDSVGSVLTPNTVAMMATSDALRSLILDMRRGYPGVVEVPPWPASNHYAFYANGIPSVALSSLEVGNITHSAADDASWVSGERIAEVVNFTRELIGGLADKMPAWSRAPS